MNYSALEYSNSGCAPLKGAQPIELGSFGCLADAVKQACERLSGTAKHRFIIVRGSRRWCVFPNHELNQVI